ncbi:MAG: 30S ribosomal protein S2 [Bacteroidia bacterium]|nr:30S ribosomal protein S2 [Bacteroidia bacterium]
MPRTEFKQLLDAGVHFGHLKRKWNPAMAPYIFMEKNGIHIIDLQKTIVKIDEAAEALKQISRSGRKVLFVATKKQAKTIVAEKVSAVNMPYVAERWPGGMLTNFPTIRKAVKKMSSIDKLIKDAAWDNLSKREKLQITRQRAKLEKVLGSIVDLTRLPAALFIVDVLKEKIAVREAQRLSIPIFAMVDTNSNPEGIDFIIPANDDASQSIDLIITTMCEAIKDGLSDRKVEREKDETDEKPFTLKKSGRKAVVKIIVEDDIEESDEKEDFLDNKIADLLVDDDLLDEEVADEEVIEEEIIDEDIADEDIVNVK